MAKAGAIRFGGNLTFSTVSTVANPAMSDTGNKAAEDDASSSWTATEVDCIIGAMPLGEAAAVSMRAISHFLKHLLWLVLPSPGVLGYCVLACCAA